MGQTILFLHIFGAIDFLYHTTAQWPELDTAYVSAIRIPPPSDSYYTQYPNRAAVCLAHSSLITAPLYAWPTVF